MNQNVLETIVGMVVLLIAIGCIVVAYESGTIHQDKPGYNIHASFTNIDGVKVGSKVKLSGVDIGQITKISFDPKTYRANVEFTVENGLSLPLDSSAAIVSNGLLGDKYLSITPGADNEMIAPGGTMQFTQSSINLEELLGKFMFSATNNNKGSNLKA